jgi:hypothetical protein
MCLSRSDRPALAQPKKQRPPLHDTSTLRLWCCLVQRRAQENRRIYLPPVPIYLISPIHPLPIRTCCLLSSLFHAFLVCVSPPISALWLLPRPILMRVRVYLPSRPQEEGCVIFEFPSLNPSCHVFQSTPRAPASPPASLSAPRPAPPHNKVVILRNPPIPNGMCDPAEARRGTRMRCWPRVAAWPRALGDGPAISRRLPAPQAAAGSSGGGETRGSIVMRSCSMPCFSP